MIEYYDCDKCGGSGLELPNREFLFLPHVVCSKCQGIGKLNWVEMLFGKQPADAFDFIEIPKLNVPFPQLTSKDIISEQPMKEPVLNTSFIKIKVSEF
jgi:hypothetical protein